MFTWKNNSNQQMTIQIRNTNRQKYTYIFSQMHPCTHIFTYCWWTVTPTLGKPGQQYIRKKKKKLQFFIRVKNRLKMSVLTPLNDQL